LHELVNRLTACYEDVKTIEELVSFQTGDTFVHSLTGRTEKVFDYILRHTVDRPRDLVTIASNLSGQVFSDYSELKKSEELRKATLEGAKKIVKDLLKEKTNFLGCINVDGMKKDFFSLIPKNTLNQKTLREICREFNGRPGGFCSSENCLKKKKDGGCVHPFCELFDVGLFGYVDGENNEQKFNEGGVCGKLMISSGYFVVHPSLCTILTEKRNEIRAMRYVITPGIIVGDGYGWSDRDKVLSDLTDYMLEECSALDEEDRDRLVNDLLEKIKNTVSEPRSEGENTAKLVASLSTEIKTRVDSVRAEQKAKERAEKLKVMRVFLSYYSKDKHPADEVDKNLSKEGLKVTRDERGLKYMMNIQTFMETLKEHDYVITVVSSNYLKSENCMYEVGTLLEDPDYKTKTLIVVLKDAEKLYVPGAVVKYVEFWEKKKGGYEKTRDESSSDTVKNVMDKEIKKCEKIIADLPKFVEFVKTSKFVNFETLQSADYSVLINYILGLEE